MSIPARPIVCLARPPGPSSCWRRWKTFASFPARNTTTSSGPLRRTKGWPRAEIGSGAIRVLSTSAGNHSLLRMVLFYFQDSLVRLTGKADILDWQFRVIHTSQCAADRRHHAEEAANRSGLTPGQANCAIGFQDRL